MPIETRRRSIDFSVDIYNIISARASLNKRTVQKEVEALLEAALALQDVELLRIMSVFKKEMEADV